MSSSNGLIQQRGDILLLVAVGRTENHHTVLQGRKAHRDNSLVLVAAGSSQPSVFPRHSLSC